MYGEREKEDEKRQGVYSVPMGRPYDSYKEWGHFFCPYYGYYCTNIRTPSLYDTSNNATERVATVPFCQRALTGRFVELQRVQRVERTLRPQETKERRKEESENLILESGHC